MENSPEAKLVSLLSSKFGAQLVSCVCNIDTAEITVNGANFVDFVKLLKLDSDLKFNMLLSVTAVDWMDLKDQRFEMVYHLLSIPFNYRLRIKVPLSENSAEIDSLESLYASADFMERECFDMYGIKFKGHPDLRRILLYDEFVGFPLRKDYPVQGKQPRVPLRHPEVENTAVQMKRSPLVTINKKNASTTHKGL